MARAKALLWVLLTALKAAGQPKATIAAEPSAPPALPVGSASCVTADGGEPGNCPDKQGMEARVHLLQQDVVLLAKGGPTQHGQDSLADSLAAVPRCRTAAEGGEPGDCPDAVETAAPVQLLQKELALREGFDLSAGVDEVLRDSEACTGEPGNCLDEPEDVAPVHLLQQGHALFNGLSMQQPDGPQQAPKNKVEKHAELIGFAEDPATTTTTPPPTGVTLNAAGDLEAFIQSFCLYYACLLAGITFFSVMRTRYPIVWANNVLEGIAPLKPGDSFFGWFSPTMAVTIDEIAEHITLDHAMLIEFTQLSMKLMAVLGIPILLIEAPCNLLFGGNAAGEDHLSYLSFGNVKDEVPLYWFHAFVVWFVVIYTTRTAHKAMREFLPRRFKWLREMPEVRANSVLVEGIPEEYRSEQKIKDMFEDILPGATIKNVEIMKDVTALHSLIQAHQNAAFALRKAEVHLAADPSSPPMIRESMMGSKVEAVPYWKKQVDELEPQIKLERQRIHIKSQSTGPEGGAAAVNLSSAFVTFTVRAHAEAALGLDGSMSLDADEWTILTAPVPRDILWADLTQDDTARGARQVIGWLFVIALFFVYMPLVIGVTNLGELITCLGPLQSVWDGVAPTLGLQFMVAFLPTFLILIFKSFFTCRAEALQQHKLQAWYFWFQVLFVILATAVGQNFREFVATLVNQPLSIFSVLASTMPYATHYYMTFLLTQVMTHGLNITRYITFAKFQSFSRLFDEKEAKALAEPEDQDFYGMGSRSAQWSIILGIGLVYGTLSPPITLLCGVNFLIARVVYGYLVVFAETKKADTGGAFYVTQLVHLFPTLIIYTVLMSGVLFQRAANFGPGIIAVLSLPWVLISLHKFKSFTWERLPMLELQDKTAKPRESVGVYVQPEMLED